MTPQTSSHIGLDEVVAELKKEAPTGPLLLALSGGLDSALLLALLVKAGLSSRLRALHVHHGLHPQADEWANHCHHITAQYGVPLEISKVTLGRGSVEDAARKVRYQALAETAQGGAVITAHHQDDQAETLLLRLMRASGVRGLGAIKKHSQVNGMRLWRPLLAVSRDTLQAWAEQLALTWVEDPSNRDDSIPRNFIRHRVIPLLREQWPVASKSLAQSAQWLQESQALLDQLAAQDAAADVASQESPVPGYPSLSVPAITSLSPERRRNVLRWWLHEHGVGAPSSPWLQELDRALSSAADRQWAVTRPPWQIRRHKQFLYLLQDHQLEPLTACIRWYPDQGEQQLGPWRLSPSQDDGNAVAIAMPVQSVMLRGVEPGDRLLRNGMHQQLSELWRAAGIPPWQRRQLPVVVDEHNRVLSVPAVGCRDQIGDTQSWWLSLIP